MKKTLIFIAILAIAGGIICFFATKDKKLVPVATIFMSKDGFSPKEVTIKQGDAIQFVNMLPLDCSPADAACNFWPASDPHPTHTIYPEFDPLEPLGPGKSWIFAFKKVGDWGYHDHFKSRNRGVIHVLAK